MYPRFGGVLARHALKGARPALVMRGVIHARGVSYEAFGGGC